MKSLIILPSSLQQVLQRLKAAGFQAFVVGGGVRDALMGRPVQDWDVATNATPKDIEGLFAKSIPTGIQHGTVTVRNNGDFFEVTTFRSDGDYKDGRRPESVQFVDSIEADLSRRDFTMNALAYNAVAGGEIVDPWGGRRDLQSRIVRTVRDADARFSEDALRLLRAARFAAQLDFKIAPETFASMRRHAPLLRKISAERIRDELRKIILSPRPVYGLSLLAETDLLREILPEFTKHPTAWQRTLRRFQLLEKRREAPDLIVALTLLCCDFDAAVSSVLLRRLRFSNDELEAVVELLRLLQPATLEKLGVLDLRHVLSSHTPKQLYRLFVCMRLWATTRAAHSKVASQLSKKVLKWQKHLSQLQEQGPSYRLDELTLNGADLLAMGKLQPGPEVGRRLRFLQDLVWLQPELNCREILQQLAVEIWRNEWM